MEVIMKRLFVLGLILIAGPSWALSAESKALVEQLRAKLSHQEVQRQPTAKEVGQIPEAPAPGSEISSDLSRESFIAPLPDEGPGSFAAPKSHKHKKHLKQGKGKSKSKSKVKAKRKTIGSKKPAKKHVGKKHKKGAAKTAGSAAPIADTSKIQKK